MRNFNFCDKGACAEFGFAPVAAVTYGPNSIIPLNQVISNFSQERGCDPCRVRRNIIHLNLGTGEISLEEGGVYTFHVKIDTTVAPGVIVSLIGNGKQIPMSFYNGTDGGTHALTVRCGETVRLVVTGTVPVVLTPFATDTNVPLVSVFVVKVK